MGSGLGLRLGLGLGLGLGLRLGLKLRLGLRVGVGLEGVRPHMEANFMSGPTMYLPYAIWVAVTRV